MRIIKIAEAEVGLSESKCTIIVPKEYSKMLKPIPVP